MLLALFMDSSEGVVSGRINGILWTDSDNITTVVELINKNRRRGVGGHGAQ